MAAENRPEEPEWLFVTSFCTKSPLNRAEEEESDWLLVDNDTCDDRPRAEACEPARLPKSPARKKQPSGGAAHGQKPPSTLQIQANDVDLGGDDDWMPPGEPTEAAATPRPADTTTVFSHYSMLFITAIFFITYFLRFTYSSLKHFSLFHYNLTASYNN